MAYDIAGLAIRVDATEAAAASVQLENMTRAGAGAETAAAKLAAEARKASTANDALARASGGASSSLREMAAAVNAVEARDRATAAAMAGLTVATDKAGASAKQAAVHFDSFYQGVQHDFVSQYVKGIDRIPVAHGGAVKSSKALTQAGLNLSRQFADVGVTAAMGISPLMILIQQGPQIADAFVTAKTQGLGFSAVMKGLAVSIYAALAPLLPFIAAAAGVAAVLGGGVALAARALNKDNKDLAKGLGLTAEQLEKVKNKGVTMGDVLKGTFNYLGKAIGPLLKPVGDFFSKLFDDITKGYVSAIKGLVGGFLGAFGAIKAVWANLPAALGDIAVSTANNVLKTIEAMINGAGKLVNGLIDKANAAASSIGLQGQISRVGAVSFEGIDNPNSGAAKQTLEAADAAFKAGRAQGDAMVDGVLKGLGQSILDAATKRIKGEAGKGKKGAKGPADPRDQTDERAAQIAGLLADARADELQAQISLTKDVEVRARLQKQELGEELNKKQAALARFAANIADDKGLTAAKKLELVGQLKTVEAINKRVAVAQSQKITDEATDAVARQALDVANARRDGEAEGLTAQLALASTAKDRGAIEKRLLSLSDERAQAEYEAIRVAKGSTETERQIAEIKLATLEATKADRQAAQERGTAIAGAQEIITELALIDSLALNAGQSLANAFGRAGGALGALVSNMTGLRVQMAEIDKAVLNNELNQTQATRERRAVQVRAYGDAASAAKGFFKTGSTGYKVLETAEKAYRAVEFAMAVKSLFFKTAETTAVVAGAGIEVAAVTGAEAAKTAATVAGSAVRTPLKIAEGAASMFAALGPFGFAAVAAMLAVMVGLGFSGGSKGGGSVPGAKDQQNRQNTQGTGTVLGDATAKSDSIAKSLETVASYTNRDLEYSNAMVRALRSIDANIGALSDALARQLGINGAFDTSGLGLGKSGKAATLSNLGFGSTTNRTLQDQGLSFGAQGLNDILAGGLSGQTYQQILEQTKKKAFGITYSNKSKSTTTSTNIDGDLAAEFTRVIGALREGVLQAASVLGLDGAQATLDAFVVNLGTISLKDLKPDEIKAALNAVFGKLGDEMAAAVLGDVAAFQKAGEGAFETLIRVARGYQVLDTTLASIGLAFGATGAASLAARERLIELAGGLDALQEQTASYAENFLSEAERMAPVQRAVATELERLGLSAVQTKAQFKGVVDGLDLTTETGAQLYAALLALAPAFAKTADYAQDLIDTTQKAAQAVADKKVDDASKALDVARSALSDTFNRESAALKSRIDAFKSIAVSLGDYREKLTAAAAGSQGPGGQYASARADFERTAAAARAGDKDALGKLQTVSDAYLSAAKSVAPDAVAYARDLAAVRQAVTASEVVANEQVDVAQAQLDAMTTMVNELLNVSQNIIDLTTAIYGFSTATKALADAQAAALLVANTGTVTPPADALTSTPNPTSPGAEAAATAASNEAANKAAMERQNELLAEQNRLLTEIAKTNTTTAATLVRVTRDGNSLLTEAA